MPPRLPPPPQVSKPGTTPNAPKLDGASESSLPIAEPDPWLLEEIEALAGNAEKDGATPPVGSSDARKNEPALVAEGVVAATPVASTSESSGARKPVEAGSPRAVTRSATAALVGIGDDLIANASAEDKRIFTSSLDAARKGAPPRDEPAVFDELGLAKTPPVITGHTVRDMPAEPASASAAAEPPKKKTDEGFPLPPPREAKPATTSPPSTMPVAPSMSRSGKPLSRWTPHVLIGALGIASIVAIAFRCSGSPASTAQAESSKHGPVAELGDAERGDAREVASANANAGGRADPADDGAGAGEPANGDAAPDDDDVQVDGEAAAAKDGDANADDANADHANADHANADDAKAEEGDPAAALADDTDGDAAEVAKDGEVQAAAAPTAKREPAGKNATPASTSKKPRSAPKPIEPAPPSPDANLTAEELLELARKAWKAGNARDAYKYANKSRYKKSSAEATELATLAACKLKLEKSAKSSFDSLSGDKRRKVRQKCREYGVWVGL